MKKKTLTLLTLLAISSSAYAGLWTDVSDASKEAWDDTKEAVK